MERNVWHWLYKYHGAYKYYVNVILFENELYIHMESGYDGNTTKKTFCIQNIMQNTIFRLQLTDAVSPPTAGWLVVPSGLLMLALSAWYGVSQYSASNAPSLPPAAARLRGPSGGVGRGHCECALPASLRVMRMLHHVFPPPIQHRMGGDEGVPDLSQLSTAELQTLLGLPDDLIPTEQEIAELQKLLEENDVPLSVLMQAGQQNKAHEEELAVADAAYDDIPVADDPHPVMEDAHVPEEDPHDVMMDVHADDPHAADPPAVEHDAPPPPPDPHVEVAAPAPPPPPNPGPPPSMAAGSFGVPFSQAAMDAAHDVFEGANVPIAAVSNPFPQNPFPADYADYGQQFLGPAAFPLSPVSYYHPVRTFKFRVSDGVGRGWDGGLMSGRDLAELRLGWRIEDGTEDETEDGDRWVVRDRESYLVGCNTG